MSVVLYHNNEYIIHISIEKVGMMLQKAMKNVYGIQNHMMHVCSDLRTSRMCGHIGEACLLHLCATVQPPPSHCFKLIYFVDLLIKCRIVQILK